MKLLILILTIHSLKKKSLIGIKGLHLSLTADFGMAIILGNNLVNGPATTVRKPQKEKYIQGKSPTIFPTSVWLK